jgi:hypothetical protein
MFSGEIRSEQALNFALAVFSTFLTESANHRHRGRGLRQKGFTLLWIGRSKQRLSEWIGGALRRWRASHRSQHAMPVAGLGLDAELSVIKCIATVCDVVSGGLSSSIRLS